MWVLETVAVAFGMYSALPVPSFAWNEKNMRYALAAFPLVGVLLGLACWGWTALCAALSLPPILRGAVLCVLPALVTGGIHLDGYADSSDALAAHAPPERAREILRDPRCGAFAVIRLCVYFAVLFALCCVLEPTKEGLCCLGLGFGLSRALSGVSLTVLPIAPGSSLARRFADAADKRRVRTILAVTAGCASSGRRCSADGAFSWPPCSCRRRSLFAAAGRRSSASAGSPAIWPGGSWSKRNSGCWRPKWSCSFGRKAYDFHYRSPVQRQARPCYGAAAL